MSRREQRRLHAAEEVCRAWRKALSYHATSAQWYNVAFDWLQVWIRNSPKKVWQREPQKVKRRKRAL